MRIATTPFGLRGEKQKRRRSDSSDSPLSQGLENCCKKVRDRKKERLVDGLLFAV